VLRPTRCTPRPLAPLCLNVPDHQVVTPDDWANFLLPVSVAYDCFSDARSQEAQWFVHNKGGHYLVLPVSGTRHHYSRSRYPEGPYAFSRLPRRKRCSQHQVVVISLPPCPVGAMPGRDAYLHAEVQDSTSPLHPTLPCCASPLRGRCSNHFLLFISLLSLALLKGLTPIGRCGSHMRTPSWEVRLSLRASAVSVWEFHHCLNHAAIETARTRSSWSPSRQCS
jgi:hypothetical protein